MLALCLLLQDGDFGFEIGRLDVGDEAPLEAGAEAVFDLGSSLGGRSEAMTICFMFSWSALKVWKNSSCVRSF